MNQKQREYAMKRVDGILERKVKEARKAFTSEGKSLTWEEKKELIKGGEVALREGISYGSSIERGFDFSRHEKPTTLAREDFDKEEARLRKEANRVKDALMLGDAEDARKVLEEFEGSEVLVVKEV